ncbi:MAG: queuosine precursor transporter [Lachnospiraceae bacterium]|nr:queuosine precursor transporter [Lachnospiraceae bacterium]
MENGEKGKSYSGAFLCMGMLFVTCLIVSNLIAEKVWGVTEHISVPASVILFPVTYILADIFTEVYGFKSARIVIWTGFACNLVAVIAYVITIDLPYPKYWLGQDAFSVVLGITPRVLLASFVGYLVGEFSNSVILSKLKIITKGNKLWLRTIGSTVVGEALDSLLFVSIAFAGTISGRQLISMILFQYLFKLVIETVFTPVTYAIIAYVKKIEGIDTYDYGLKYRLF